MDDYSLTSSPPPTFAYCSLGVDCKFAVIKIKRKLTPINHKILD
jgi:hypothetical protein